MNTTNGGILVLLFTWMITSGPAAAQVHPDSLAADSAAARERTMSAMIVPMALPSPPNISYTVPSQLQVGTLVSFTPTNTGGAVYADGDVTTFAGSTQGYADGTGTAAKFYYPSSIVPDASGNLYVSDYRNHRIRKITPEGVVTTFAGSGVAGTANGTGTAAQFNGPNGLAMDASGNLYVADRSNHRLRKITPAGVVTTLAGSTQGFANGTGSAAKFNAPVDVAVDGSGNVYMTEDAGQRVRKITPSGVVTTLAGSGSVGSANGTGTAASFNYPSGIAIDGSGNLYVGDQLNNQIRKVTLSGVVTTFATGVTRPVSLERDGSGNFYAGLLGNKLVRISTTGVVTDVAGTGGAGADNGAPLSASFRFPAGLHFYPQGTVYIADQQNNRIRRMGPGQGYSISPALPTGLSLNKTTGVISGTPTTATGSVTYTVTAHNAGGTDTYTFTFSIGGGAFSADRNYILKRVYIQPLAIAPGNPTVEQAMQDITYFDGLGRPIQGVAVKATPSKTRDVVTPTAYDAYGRQEYQYLPYATAADVGGKFKANAVTAQGSYYSSSATVPAGQTAHAYARSRTVFEASPLSRVLEQGFPGQAWQPASSRTATTGHTVATENTVNNATAFGTVATTRMVSRYGVTLSAAGVPTLTLNGTHAAGELYVTVTKDENWNGQTGTFAGRLHTVEEYRDKQDRVVLRRTFNGTNELLSTYYVYNDLGQLSFVLTPELGPDRTGTTAPTATELNNHAYQYQYDGRGRVIEKKVVGRGTENFVYNPIGWVVYHQDARQASETVPGFTPGQYHTFYKYDGQGRVIMKGVERNRTWTREQIQNYVNTQPPYWEGRTTATGNFHGYTNLAQPQGAAPGDRDVLEVNYYDRYDGIPGLPHNQSAGYSKLTHGRLVASKVKVIGTSSTYLWTIYYYDDKGNVVRQWKQHYLGGSSNANKFDDITNEYDFAGQLAKSTRKHHTTSAATPAVTVVTEYIYDHRGRLVDTWKKVNTGTRTLMARNAYNEMGQLHTKQLHSTNGTAFGQQVTYSYNTRGWLTASDAPLFKQMLGYNAGTAPQYNGNITSQAFTRHNLTGTPALVTDTYTYTYDGVNRLLQGAMAGNKGRETLTYTKNGNIKTLVRTATSSTVVDNLTYTYTGNRLSSVADAATSTDANYQLPGTTGYTYDANGNVKTRVNSGSTGNNITAVTYNYLNLPQSVTASTGNVTYTYDGTGRKLRSINGINGQTRDYIDGIEYTANGATMELIHTEEGRITRSGSTYTYHYFLRDHLGNNRVGFAQGTNVITPNFTADYYPFGLQYRQYVRAGSPKINYLYNGKELQDGIKQYDYGARFYDPVIGRFGSVDPLSESMRRYSPYNYGFNNPLRFVDPDGMAPFDWIKDRYGNYLDDPNATDQSTTRQGWTYVGKDLPEGVHRLNILEETGGKLYHKNTGNALASLGNAVFGEGTFTEKKSYDPVTDGFMDEAAATAAGGLAGAGVGKVVSKAAPVVANWFSRGANGVRNPVPSRLARVVPAEVNSGTLGAPGATDVFVTAADDIAGLSASQIANRLTIPNSTSGFRIIEFSTPRIGLSSPINRTNPGFVGFGRTAGGAREFTIPNQVIPNGAIIRIVQ